LLAIVLGLACALPATATDFSLYGSYWDTDAAGDAAGGGISLGLPFNETLAVELRATYFEELSDDPLANAFDSDDPVFQEQGINVTPLEIGLRVSFPQDSFRPYVAGGAGYYLLDSDFGEVDDEVGYYAASGAAFGNPDRIQFFVEATYRKMEGEVQLDPEDLEDIDDIDIDDRATFDLDGFGANLGVRWTF
jgi:hypothetical protein